MRFNIISDNIKDSKKNIITLHTNKILTMTNTFTVISIFPYKITFSLGILTMANRSPDIQTKAYHMVISSLYLYTWVIGIQH